MGGYGSTRWKGTPTHDDIDGQLSLDVRWLKRVGALTPGAISLPSWSCRGEIIGSAVATMSRDGCELVLEHTVPHHGAGLSTPKKEVIWLDWTACHYGGQRVWFQCPGCERRCAVLFRMSGRFRCRRCHQVAYTSTRENACDRSLRRLGALRKRLGATGGSRLAIPPKPDGMHWSTYARLSEQIDTEVDRQMTFLDEQLTALTQRIERRAA
jgi:hypothetical protein